MKRKLNVRFLCETGIIAAIYAVLTLALAPISFGAMQVRISEALCILPFFTPAGIPGLFIGCVLSNLLGSPLGLMDIIVGSLATLLAALAASKVKNRWLVPLPSVVANAFLVAWVLHAMLGLPYWLNVLYVGIGQGIACYGIGMPLLFLLERNRKVLFNHG